LAALKRALGDDAKANVTQEFADFNAFTVVEKEHVKHLNELFMAAMGEGSTEIMDYLWLDSPNSLCAIDADQAVYTGYSNITDMWNRNFLVQRQQQMQLEMEQGKTYSMQIEQLGEATLHFYGDTVMVQTDIRVTCIVSDMIADNINKPAGSSSDMIQKQQQQKGGRRRKNSRHRTGKPMPLSITNIFVRPYHSDRYFLSTHIASWNGASDSSSSSSSSSSSGKARRLRASKEAYLDTSQRSTARAKEGGAAAGLSLQQLLRGGIVGNGRASLSINGEEIDDDDDEDDDDEDSDDDEDEYGDNEYDEDDDYIEYADEDEDDDNDDDGTIRLTVSASDTTSAADIVQSLKEAANGKMEVVVKDIVSGEEDDEDDDMVLNGTLSDDTPTIGQIFSAEIIKKINSDKGSDVSGDDDEEELLRRPPGLQDNEWARLRDTALVRKLGGQAPGYSVASVSDDGGDNDASGGDVDVNVGSTRDEISSRTLHAIRFLHASKRLTSDQKRTIVTDLLKKSVTAELSKAEIAYSLIMEHANPERLERHTLSRRRPDFKNLTGQGKDDLLELEEMLITIYNEWSDDDDE
jgi:hypothetical protein